MTCNPYHWTDAMHRAESENAAADARVRRVREATIRLAVALDVARSNATDEIERLAYVDQLDAISEWLDGDAFEKAAPFHAAAMKREREDRRLAHLARGRETWIADQMALVAAQNARAAE